MIDQLGGESKREMSRGERLERANLAFAIDVVDNSFGEDYERLSEGSFRGHSGDVDS